MKNFGQIFHNGKILNLETAEDSQLNTIIGELKKAQKRLKNSIDECLEKLKKM